MKITLLNPRLKTWSPNVYVPLGLAYIGAVLERAGHAVEIIDLNVHRVKDRRLRQIVNGSDIVGITGMITEYHAVVELATTVRAASPQARIILGGPLATALPEKLLAESGADFLVLGEGEKTIIDLVLSIENNNDFNNINGIAYIVDDNIKITDIVEPILDLDTVPFPARHLLDMDRYIKDHFQSFGIKIGGFGKIRSTNLLSSRGCPYNCTFCFKDMWGHKWRGRSPENIIREMESVHRDYRVNGFFFNDDTFVLDRDRVYNFCRQLQQKRLKIVWYCNGRVNLMTEELLLAMYDAGCRGIAYGIESGNQEILDSLKKKETLEQVRDVVTWTGKAGIHVTGYFMLGNLGETRETIRQTIDFARELNLDYHGFSLTTPIPGTELYDSAVKAGLITGDAIDVAEWSQHANANLTRDCTDDDLVRFSGETFREFYLKKRFGKYYMINPSLIKEGIKMLGALRNIEQLWELLGKAWGVFGFKRNRRN
jgi:anaerobic magnesium-protoporphyrin IX monomethyl ester cyclase